MLRYVTVFLAGVLVLFGARLAGGFTSIQNIWLFEKIAGGKVMPATGSDTFQALLPIIPGTLLGTGIGIAFMGIAWILPERV